MEEERVERLFDEKRMFNVQQKWCSVDRTCVRRGHSLEIDIGL